MAAGSTTNNEDLEQKLTCSICLQLFREPRLLPCGHTFCQHCLVSFIASRPAVTIDRGQGFHCPVCREFTPAPDRMTPSHQWAVKFKPNFLIRDIVEVHGKSKAQRVIRPPCPRHPGKSLELYCRDCRTDVCDRCVALEHRRCEEVLEVAQVQARETQQAARRHQQTVLRLLKQLEAKKKRCINGRRDLERIERDIDAKIEREGHELLRKVVDFLRHRKETLKRQAHAHCRQCVSVVNAYTEKCNELSGTLRSLDRALSSRLRPDRPQNKIVDAQEEVRVSALVAKLDSDIQQLDSPCHFTVRLIMDDTALTTILSSLKLGEIRTGSQRSLCVDDASSESAPPPPYPGRRPSSACSLRRPASAYSAASLHGSSSSGNISGVGLGPGYGSGRSTPLDPRPAAAAASAFPLYNSANHNRPPSPPQTSGPFSPGSSNSSPFQFPVATSSPIPLPAPASLTNKKQVRPSASSDFHQRGHLLSERRPGAAVVSGSSKGGYNDGDAVACSHRQLPPPPPPSDWQRQRRKSATKPPADFATDDALERTPVRRKLSQP